MKLLKIYKHLKHEKQSIRQYKFANKMFKDVRWNEIQEMGGCVKKRQRRKAIIN